ncbi:MAG TPA: xanthine dehydrogenase family protein subunit M [Gemmatimonadaceae bacterium]|jgi:carbon-monoxide dehydrogenase medium subunit
MHPASFDYSAPSTVDEAVRLLAEHGDGAKLLAGGHSLLPLMKLRFAQPTHVVDLRRIPSLRGIRRDGNLLAIGAMTTYAELAASRELFDTATAIVDAASQVGDPQVRNRGTIGGSIAHADPAADIPATMLALGASFVAQGQSGRRFIAAGEFFRDLYTTALSADELLVEIRVPVSISRAGSAYAKHPHPATRFALVGVAAAIELERMSDRVQRARVAVTGLANTPLRAIAVEEALTGQVADPDHIIAAAEHLVASAEETGAYKAQLARTCAEAALRKAAERAQ